MGILDSLENSPAFRGALGQLEAAVVPVVLSEVLGNGSQGGLNAIVAKLQQAGFGDQVKSWIGNGKSADHRRAVAAGARQRHRQAVGRAIQYSGRSARQGSGAAATQCGGPGQPGRQAAAYGLKSAKGGFPTAAGRICPESPEAALSY
jgi:hypothetical protein